MTEVDSSVISGGMRPLRFRADAGIMVVLLFSSAMVGSFIMFGQVEQAWIARCSNVLPSVFGTAVMVATGRGFVEPVWSEAPALESFLKQERTTLRPGDIPADLPVREPLEWGYRHRYLFYAVSSVWHVFGISWNVFKGFMVAMFCISVLLVYGILRIGMGRLVSFGGTVLFMLSPTVLASLPQPRDFHKAVFILAALLILGCLVKYPMRRVAFWGCALLLGSIVGIGIGFRNDPAICILPGTVVLLSCRRPVRGLALGQRIVAVILLVVTYQVVGWPILKVYRETGQPAHDVGMGLATKCDNAMRVGKASYERVYMFNDPFIVDTFDTSFRRETGGANKCYLEQSGRRFLYKMASTFPADMLVRLYSAVLAIVGDLSPPMGQAFGRRIMLCMVIAAFVLMSRSDMRNACIVAFLFLYFCGYPCLQFEPRHCFHLAIAPIWVAGYTVDRLLRTTGVLQRWTGATKTDLSHGVFHKDSLHSWSSVACLGAGLGLLLIAPVWAASPFQHRAVMSLVHSYANAESVDVETRRIDCGDWVLFHPTGPHSQHLLVSATDNTVTQDSCWYLDLANVPGSLEVMLWYETVPLQGPPDYSQVLLVRSGESELEGPAKYFFPVYETGMGLAGWQKFSGVAFRREFAGVFRGLHRVKDAGHFPLLLNVLIPDNKEQFRWGQHIQLADGGHPQGMIYIDLTGTKQRAQRARQLQESGDLDGAITQYQEALASHAQDLGCLHGLASALEAKAQYDAAQKTYLTALDADPDLPETYARLDKLFQRSGDPGNRFNQWRSIANLHPDFAGAQYYLALVSAEANDAAGAREAYERALALRPRDSGIRVALGNLLLEGGELDEASELCRTGLALQNQKANLLELLGQCLERKGDYSGAREAYSRALAADPACSLLVCNRLDALLEERYGRDERVSFWRDAVGEYPKMADPRKMLEKAMGEATGEKPVPGQVPN